jgi:hypothetical protein
MILFDVPPPPFSDPISITVGIGFFFIFAAVAIALFILLKRRVHVGIRLVIVAAILLIAVVGSIFISFISAALRYQPVRPPGVGRIRYQESRGIKQVSSVFVNGELPQSFKI